LDLFSRFVLIFALLRNFVRISRISYLPDPPGDLRDDQPVASFSTYRRSSL
jgi:hypothetical protein